MKKIIFIATLGATSLCASSAMASPSSSTSGGTLAVQEVSDSKVTNPRAAESLFRSVRGAYNLDDGTVLRVYRDNNAYLAAVTGRQPVQVAITKNGEFVSRDDAVQIRFLKNSGGLYDGVVLSTLSGNGMKVVRAGRSNGG